METAMNATPVDRPLAGLRIVDALRGPIAPLTRYLAELGAIVERIAPSDSDPVADLAGNNGKRRVAAGRREQAIAQAHAVVVDPDAGIDLARLRAERPSLVTMMVSDFGTDNSFSGWQATDAVFHALTGELSRSGMRGRAPLLPPGALAYQCAAAQGAFVLVSALYRSLRTGAGDHLDFAVLDGAMQALDPGFGISGSAALGKPAHLLSRDRPARGFQYPILRCADGYVRICLLAKRQWQGMFRWMGEPPAFAGPEFEKTAVRYKSPDLLPAIAAFFADRKRADLETEGQTFGVPISAVLTFEEALNVDHLRARAALVATDVGNGAAMLLPNGVVTVDGARMGPGAPDDPVEWTVGSESDAPLPFAGLKVLDLGVIVVGAEAGRLLADGGADVVKVESRAYPDGNRQSYLPYGMSVSFAAGHRNKRSLGINLRVPEGRDLFLDLASRADVILSNFKPGTMESLGLGYREIARVNPGIVMVDSSAFGATGPWSDRMGYGPLVRAATGLTLAWRYDDDAQGFCDSVTIYPDHVAGRISAMAAVALLIRRLRTARGGTASVAQSEVMLAQFAEDVGRASLGRPAPAPRDWPWSVYPTAGDDEWCVVTVRDDADWQRLAPVIGLDDPALSSRDGRIARRDVIDRALVAWLGGHTADEAMRLLQARGVPAARMLRVAELPDFDYYRSRDLFRVENHPYLDERVVAERRAVRSTSLNEAPLIPAPLMGEHSVDIVTDWLGGAIDPLPLVARNIIEPTDADTWNAVRAAGRTVPPAALAATA